MILSNQSKRVFLLSFKNFLAVYFYSASLCENELVKDLRRQNDLPWIQLDVQDHEFSLLYLLKAFHFPTFDLSTPRQVQRKDIKH